VAERVEGVVLRHRVVAQNGPPEADVQLARPGGYRQLNLLHGTAVRDGSVTTSDLGNRPRQVDVMWFEELDATRQPHRKAAIAESEQGTRTGDPWHFPPQ
jgi:hypothetical protein